MKNNLVSIVVPVHNAEKYIKETIQSVLDQTYQQWELLLVDDGSSDKCRKIIDKIQKTDKRIRVYDHGGKNLGAGPTRNAGVKHAKGRFIAFLDADDLWHKEKLHKQVEFMNKTGAAFSCTSYEFARHDGSPSGVKVQVPLKASYRQVLTNVTVWTSTVMFDMKQLNKKDIQMPNIPRGQDAATWWKVLKKVDYAYGLQDVLAYYRRSKGSLSANKVKAVKRTWRLYRQIENYGVMPSTYYLAQHSCHATIRRIALRRVQR